MLKISGISTDPMRDVHTEFGRNRATSVSGRTLTSVFPLSYKGLKSHNRQFSSYLKRVRAASQKSAHQIVSFAVVALLPVSSLPAPSSLKAATFILIWEVRQLGYAVNIPPFLRCQLKPSGSALDVIRGYYVILVGLFVICPIY